MVYFCLKYLVYFLSLVFYIIAKTSLPIKRVCKRQYVLSRPMVSFVLCWTFRGHFWPRQIYRGYWIFPPDYSVPLPQPTQIKIDRWKVHDLLYFFIWFKFRKDFLVKGFQLQWPFEGISGVPDIWYCMKGLIYNLHWLNYLVVRLLYIFVPGFIIFE